MEGEGADVSDNNSSNSIDTITLELPAYVPPSCYGLASLIGRAGS